MGKVLFGDDVSKSAKEIEDCPEISNKIFDRHFYPGGPIRSIMDRGFRFRGGYGRGMRPRDRGRGLMETHASKDDFPKTTRDGGLGFHQGSRTGKYDIQSR